MHSLHRPCTILHTQLNSLGLGCLNMEGQQYYDGCVASVCITVGLCSLQLGCQCVSTVWGGVLFQCDVCCESSPDPRLPGLAGPA